jgi:hypothetical protein
LITDSTVAQISLTLRGVVSFEFQANGYID